MARQRVPFVALSVMPGLQRAQVAASTVAMGFRRAPTAWDGRY